MSLELLQEISDNYQIAKLVHEEASNVCWFLYLPGFALMHEHQLISESMTQRQIKRYATSTYNAIMLDKIPQSANIVEPLIGSKNRKQLKMQDNWEIIRQLFQIHMNWEENALKKYEKIAFELVAKGDVSAFNFVGEIIKDVKAELVFVTDLIIGYNAMEWDMPTIIDQQDTYIERYEFLIRNLLGKSRKYHHHNSNVDPESRTTLLDKYPD